MYLQRLATHAFLSFEENDKQSLLEVDCINANCLAPQDQNVMCWAKDSVELYKNASFRSGFIDVYFKMLSFWTLLSAQLSRKIQNNNTY